MSNNTISRGNSAQHNSALLMGSENSIPPESSLEYAPQLMLQNSRISVSIDEASELVGVSSCTIRRAIYDERLRAFRPGKGSSGKLLIRVEEIHRWINDCEESNA